MTAIESPLDIILDLAKQDQIIAIDTEFDRQNSYFPILSLIQISTKNHHYALLDCLSIHSDQKKQIKALFLDPAIRKVFHSCRQDIEAIHRFFDIYPQNIADTQIMAAALGMGQQVSYVTLAALCNAILDKKYQFSDWIKRPLSPAQISYAINDVIYLLCIYHKLLEELQQKEISMHHIEDKNPNITAKNTYSDAQ